MQIESYSEEAVELIKQDLVIHFPDGIPAFEDITEYTLTSDSNIEPFMRLTSLQDPDFGFFCIDPFQLDAKYKCRITDQDQKELGIQDPDDVLVLSIVKRAAEPKDFTANLMAPLIMNIRNKRAKQIILDKYPVRLNILEAINQNQQSQDAKGETESC